MIVKVARLLYLHDGTTRENRPMICEESRVGLVGVRLREVRSGLGVEVEHHVSRRVNRMEAHRILQDLIYQETSRDGFFLRLLRAINESWYWAIRRRARKDE